MYKRKISNIYFQGNYDDSRVLKLILEKLVEVLLLKDPNCNILIAHFLFNSVVKKLFDDRFLEVKYEKQFKTLVCKKI